METGDEMAAGYTREVIDNSPEKDLVTGAIVSTSFLEQVAPQLTNLSLIQEPNIRRILIWCLDYFKKYQKAPGGLIHDIFLSKKKEIGNDDICDMIDTILHHINERYVDNPELFSVPYYVTKTRTYLEEQSYLRLAEEIKGGVATGQLEIVRRAITNFNKVDKTMSMGVDPFKDKAFISAIFENMKEGIIKFPYPALSELFQEVYKGDIIAVAGPAKRGKSFLMSLLGSYAHLSGLNVAEFSYEMDKEVMGMRLFQRLIGETKRATEEVLVPQFDEDNNIVYTKVDKNGLTLQETREFQETFSRYSKAGSLRLYDHNKCGRKVSDICDALDRLEKYEDTKVDVVVIDYDALLENEYGFRGETYDGINKIWQDVKSKIAQDRNTLVIFGSQYGKEGAKKEVGPESASHSSRKFDYVSHWVSILQTEAEKRAGVMRLSVVGRHDQFYASNRVVCLQSLALARPILDCRWQKDVPNLQAILQVQQEEIAKYAEGDEEKIWFKGKTK
jgi:hypothetical protein